MSAAADTMIFGPRCDQLEVLFGSEAAGNQREKTRPTGAAVVFHLRRKKRQCTTGADEYPGSFLAVERARKGVLGALLSQDFELGRRQQIGRASCRERV